MYWKENWETKEILAAGKHEKMRDLSIYIYIHLCVVVSMDDVWVYCFPELPVGRWACKPIRLVQWCFSGSVLWRPHQLPWNPTKGCRLFDIASSRCCCFRASTVAAKPFHISPADGWMVPIIKHGALQQHSAVQRCVDSNAWSRLLTPARVLAMLQLYLQLTVMPVCSLTVLLPIVLLGEQLRDRAVSTVTARTQCLRVFFHLLMRNLQSHNSGKFLPPVIIAEQQYYLQLGCPLCKSSKKFGNI